MKQARSTVWVTALTYAKVVSQPLELWEEKWWNWRNGICYSYRYSYSFKSNECIRK